MNNAGICKLTKPDNRPAFTVPANDVSGLPDKKISLPSANRVLNEYWVTAECIGLEEFHDSMRSQKHFEGYASKINVGDKVTVFFPDLNKELTASVTFASRYISQINRSFSVEANLQGEIPHLKANMIALLKIVDYHNETAISIPFNYIQGDKKGYYVFFGAVFPRKTVFFQKKRSKHGCASPKKPRLAQRASPENHRLAQRASPENHRLAARTISEARTSNQ